MAAAPSSPTREGLLLRPGTLAAACFLVVTAIALAYVGGVMAGRAYSDCLMEKKASAQVAQAAAGKAEENAPPSEMQTILTPSELGFARALRSTGTADEASATDDVSPAVAPAVVSPAALEQGQASPSGPVVSPEETLEKPQAATMFDYVFQVAAFRDEDSVDALRQRLEGRGLRTRMQREGKLFFVQVLLRGTEASAAEVPVIMNELRLGKPLLLNRKPVAVP